MVQFALLKDQFDIFLLQFVVLLTELVIIFVGIFGYFYLGLQRGWVWDYRLV